MTTKPKRSCRMPGPVPVPSRWGVPDPDICRKRATKPPSRRAVAERVYEALFMVPPVLVRRIYPAVRADIVAAIERAIGEADQILPASERGVTRRPGASKAASGRATGDVKRAYLWHNYKHKGPLLSHLNECVPMRPDPLCPCGLAKKRPARRGGRG